MLFQCPKVFINQVGSSAAAAVVVAPISETVRCVVEMVYSELNGV